LAVGTKTAEWHLLEHDVTFERGLYAEGWRILKQCWPYGLFAVGGELVIQVFEETSDAGTGMFFVSVLV